VSGRHRSYGQIGRGRVRVPVALATVTALVAVAFVTVRIVSASASGCSGGIGLRVAATPEIALVLEDIGAEWMATEPQVGGECVNLRIESVASPTVASMLSVYAGSAIDVAAVPEPTPAEDALPMVWVPDSSAWLLRVQAIDRAAFQPEAQSVASSPVVVAMPEQAAQAVGWPARRLQVASMKELLTGGNLQLGIAEPRRDTASLAATIMLGEALATTSEDLPAVVKTFREVVKTSSTGELLGTFGTRVNAGPASEQAILAYNATSPTLPLVAVQLDPPGPHLDYPYAIRAGMPREETQAAEQFRSAILAVSGAAKLASKAFRTPDGETGTEFPSSSATTTERYVSAAITEPDRVQRALGLWSAANSPSRTVALFDITSSMASEMQTPAGPATRAAVMVGAASGGLGLFTTDSRLGMWVFGQQHQELLSIDDLTPDRRAEFDRLMAQARPSASNQSELYETLLAAYKVMKDGYDPTRPNIIVVLTDGGDSDPTPLRRERFNQDLQKLADPTKPIRVVLIGIGVGPADAANLEAIAQIVGGGYFPLTSPAQIQTIFLNALLRVGAA
jgi:hypothetical protein